MKPDCPSLPDHPGASHVDLEGTVSTVGECFRLLLLAAAWRVVGHAHEMLGGPEAVSERFPFLTGYAEAFDEADVLVHGPLTQLAQAARWPSNALELWLVAGLIEEDARFGAVFEAIDPDLNERRPGLALMQTWWGTLPGEGLRPALRKLLDHGLLRSCAPGSSRADSVYEVEDNCWAAARGEPPERPWPGIRLAEPEQAPALDLGVGAGGASDTLLLPAEARERLTEWAPRLYADGGAIVIRGPEQNGRTRLLAALARAEGRRALIIDWPLPPQSQLPAGEAPAWLGAFATLTQARPILRVSSTPGERLRLPDLDGYSGWIGVVCGEEDAVEGLPAPAYCLRLPLPDIPLRQALIEAHGDAEHRTHARELAALVHLSSGHLVRALKQSALSTRETDAAGMARALREVALTGGSAELDTLARRLDDGAGHQWEQLVIDGELRRDLLTLEARCRQRDRLREMLPAGFAARIGAGVRALFAGPSGTGKTLAALVLASRLGVPIYRLDLSSVVSKYIGETERNLHRLLTATESLDALLLLDEGDALLARRTDVGNAHDRYANLETNFLLQRLESHRGLVIVTTNALEHIDGAFLRRFDALLQFQSPEFPERLALWRAHLPPDHRVGEATLERIAEACALPGGQVRNVVLAACSAALAWDRPVDEALLLDALQRQYRRNGTLYPLRG